MKSGLFRQEALESRRDKLYGGALQLRVPSFAALTIALALMAAAIVSLGIWGEFTRKERVMGYLAPTKGLIKVFTPQAGTVAEKRVVEGQEVTQGEVLLVISSERVNAATQETQAAMLQELRERRDSLRRERVTQAQIDELTAEGLRARILGLEAELLQARSQLALQRQRVASAEGTVKRHEELVKGRFVAELTLQERREELLERRSELAGLQRSITGLDRDLGAARMELRAIDLTKANHTAAINRQISELEQQLTELDARRLAVITAPADGTVTTILAKVGQTASPSLPLLSILPAGAALEAHLLVPTRAAGFIRPAQAVALRYQAFPYQRFGHHLGTIAEVGRTILQPNEVVLPLPVEEPVYRVTVRLAAQQVLAYGQSLPLQAGMVLDADVQVDRRRLIQWIFDPIVSVTGRL
jgi:membrane fusion protein